MADKRKDRVQPIRLAKGYFALDIHKSMFLTEMQITLPSIYVESWGGDILSQHNKDNKLWNIDIVYYRPKDLGEEKLKFRAKLYLSFIKNRSKISSYRLKWKKDFSAQLASDYPKSFVRGMEYEMGDEYYKSKKYTEFDIGGFKEQLQVNITWKDNKPTVIIKEYFRVKDEGQIFPRVYEELSTYLIADYLLASKEEVLRRIHVSKWKKRKDIKKEVNENNIYILLNREKKQVYFGETKLSLSSRYSNIEKSHALLDWDEYCVVHLPSETSEHTRLLIERVLIAFGSKIFPNILYDEAPILDKDIGYKLMNRKK